MESLAHRLESVLIALLRRSFVVIQVERFTSPFIVKLQIKTKVVLQNLINLEMCRLIIYFSSFLSRKLTALSKFDGHFIMMKFFILLNAYHESFYC